MAKKPEEIKVFITGRESVGAQVRQLYPVLSSGAGGGHRRARLHVRHHETKYDEYLVRGGGRDLARAAIAEDVDRVLAAWQRPPADIRD